MSTAAAPSASALVSKRTATVIAVAGALLTAGLLAAAWTLAALEGDAGVLGARHGPDLLVPIGHLAFNVAIILGIGVAIPAACAVAILRYRLYDIDVVISRTIVCAALAVFITAVSVRGTIPILSAVASTR